MLSIEETIQSQLESMKKSYPDYEILELTNDEYLVFTYSLRMQMDFCDELLDSPLVESVGVKNRGDVFNESVSLKTLLDFITNHSYGLTFNDIEDDKKECDLYLIPVPKDYNKFMLSLIHGSALLFRDFSDRIFEE